MHNRFLSRIPVLVPTFLFLTSVSPLTVRGQEGNPAKKPVFSFSEGLPGAKVTLKANEQVLPGIWQVDRFQFEGMPGVSDVVVTDFAMEEGKPSRQVIWAQPLPQYEYTLTYSQVPAGRRLTLFFGLGDSFLKKTKLAPVRFEVWIGEKQIFSSTLLAKGWGQKKVDLMLPFLLKRKFNFRFVLRNLEQGKGGFVFNAQIE